MRCGFIHQKKKNWWGHASDIIAALPVPNATKWLLFEPSWCSPGPFPNLDNGLEPGPLPGCEAADTSRPSRFCLACSAINCHFESISLPPTACRAATFAAFVLILSSSSLLGYERLRMSGNRDTSQLRNQHRKVTLTFFGRLSSFSFSNSVAPLPSAYKEGLS